MTAGAFRRGPWESPVEGRSSTDTTQPLLGLRFAVKAVIDVAGLVTDAGNPAFEASHPPAARDAPCVTAMRRAGAHLVGTTVTDELAFSLSGTNVHHGTPTNPAAPDREPGGSSAGSAVAVASGLVDIALGTDTGGSIRVPASNCGIVGVRPTHGAISTDGVVPLAPSFDTVGALARELSVLRRALAVLRPPGATSPARAATVVLPTDLLGLVSPLYADLVRSGARRLARAHGAGLEERELAGGDLETWFRAFRILQGREAWMSHGDWIGRAGHVLGPGIAARFRAASTITDADVEATSAARARARACIRDVLGPSTLLVLPAAAGPALPLAAPPETKEAWRATTLRLTCVGGLSGAPAVVLPAGSIDGSPVGVSVLAPPMTDHWLLDMAQPLAAPAVDAQAVR